MPSKYKKLFYLSLILVALISTALAFAKSGISLPAAGEVEPASPRQSETAQRKTTRRNLSLQPEAFNLTRRLGKRFAPDTRGQSILVGTLTVGAERRVVRVIRRQSDDGEQLKIDLAGSHGPLTWDAEQGAKESGERAGKDRDLIERLVLDSPDQFVLAQLRGASYYTIARNVRPEEAGDGYTGPLWNIVRIDDPQRDEQKKPRSPWRLYYIDTRTGLIDRIVSEVDGERIEAALSGWTEVNGEKVPGEITWTRQGQTLMQFRLTNFSHDAQK
jgi:hypothetical protein